MFFVAVMLMLMLLLFLVVVVINDHQFSKWTVFKLTADTSVATLQFLRLWQMDSQLASWTGMLQVADDSVVRVILLTRGNALEPAATLGH